MKFSLNYGTLTLITALGLSLSACGSNAAEEQADPVEQAAEQTAAALDQQADVLPDAPSGAASEEALDGKAGAGDASEDATEDGAAQ